MKRATDKKEKIVYNEKHFNPRPREEGDGDDSLTEKEADISIHALVKRATANLLLYVPLLFISIHALVKRATSELSQLNVAHII